MKRVWIAAVVFAVIGILGVAGCKKSSNNDSEGGNPPGPLAACMAPGQVLAGVISDPSEYLVGLDPDPAVGNHEKSALGTVGDFKLMNNRAAFIIQKAAWRDSYFPFGGNLIDAVSMVDCLQAGPEQFQELQLMVGQLDLGALNESFLRAVQGEFIEVINDGTDGNAAIVRVTGTDAIFQTVELNLKYFGLTLGASFVNSPVLNLITTIDYILPPDSSVLQMNLTVQNTLDTPLDLIDGMGIFYGDTTPIKFPFMGGIGVAEFSLNLGVPWMVASRGDSAYAVAIPDADMAGVSISGLTAAIDYNLVVTPIHIEAAGTPGDSHTFINYFTVGPTDQNSALVELYDLMPNPIPTMTITPTPLAGWTFDLLTDPPAPIPGAEVTLEMLNPKSQWVFLTGFVTDENGEFDGMVPVPTGASLRVVASSPGRRDSQPLAVVPGVGVYVSIPLGPEGNFAFDVRDETGSPIPAKIVLWQGGEAIYRFHPETGMGSAVVAPGVYEVTVTRGLEFTTVDNTVYIPNDGLYYLHATLDKVVDTTGWMSVDPHIHSGRSPDNSISVEDRVRTCAGEGIEVPVATDHEFLGSWQWAVDKLGLNAWTVNVAGEEVTAPLPGHSNIYPVVPDYSIDARGGYVQWMGMDVSQIFAANRARGAQIVAANHPRSGIFMAVDWNPLTGQPDLTDPTLIGQQPGSSLWDWDFDTMELQNGNQNPFKDPAKPLTTGTFEDWMSFLNMGHLKTANGVSDAHNWDMPGYARSYFESPTDSTLEFQESNLVDAMKSGRILVSTGAFARVAVNNDYGIGDLVPDDDGTVDLWVHIEALPNIDVSYFKIFVNCDQVIVNGHGYISTGDPYAIVKYDGIIQVPISQDSYIIVMGFGEDYLPLGLPQFDPTGVPRFTTNAIYIDYNGNNEFDAPGLKTCNYGLPE